MPIEVFFHPPAKSPFQSTYKVCVTCYFSCADSQLLRTQRKTKRWSKNCLISKIVWIQLSMRLSIRMRNLSSQWRYYWLFSDMIVVHGIPLWFMEFPCDSSWNSLISRKKLFLSIKIFFCWLKARWSRHFRNFQGKYILSTIMSVFYLIGLNKKVPFRSLYWKFWTMLKVDDLKKLSDNLHWSSLSGFVRALCEQTTEQTCWAYRWVLMY